MMRNFPLPSRLARTGCSVLALATAFVVGPSPAAAQSFLGTGTATNGAGTTITNGTNTTTISVTAPQTVINWVPTDNATNNNVPIAFQNSGTTANFLGTGNFAVLNNIVATDLSRVISMNGTITAGALGAAAAANGSIYFYSPSGIVLGGSSLINVGSLVLSASPIFVDGNGNFINGSSNQVIFGQALRPTAAITTNAGSQINATAGDAYVAMVAPRVQHGGSIDVNGSAALVGAEAATINFSPDGLFDIQVTSGTTDSQGVSTNGIITGSASTGAADGRRAFLVAVPKNTALTMAISNGADLGFDIAGAANVSGNAVILSAGHDIVDGVAETARAAGGGTGTASINAANLNATSALSGAATGTASVFSTNLNSTFSSNVNLRAAGNIIFGATGAGTLLVNGNLALSTDRAVGGGSSAAASNITLLAQGGGTTRVAGSIDISADAVGQDSTAAGVAGGNATGGTVAIYAVGSGARLDLQATLNATATGTGGDATTSGANAGTGRGGRIDIGINGPDAVATIAGPITVNANGMGGNAVCASCNGLGGEGRGGFILLGDDGISGAGGGSITLGSVSASATGSGGAASAPALAAGTGTGGTIQLRAIFNNTTMNIGALSADAGGIGGDAAGVTTQGGLGFGGVIRTTVFGSGTAVTVGDAALYAGGYGGSAGGEGCITCAGPGGAGMGGTIDLATGGPGTALTVNGDVFAATEGRGGFGITGGGIGTGGTTSSTYASASTIMLDRDVDFSALGYGGDSANGNGGTGTGGRALLGAQTGATGSLVVAGNVSTDVSGYGGNALGSGSGGLGRGGRTDNGGSGGTIDFQGDFTGTARGQGGYSENGIGGDGAGGDGWVDAFGATIDIGGNFVMNTGAEGGVGATGGSAMGGNAYLAASSAFTLDGSALLLAHGTGGIGNAGSGGNGIGGLANVRATNNAILLVGASVDAFANGSGGDDGMVGGNGTGGQAIIQALTGGTLNVSDSLTGRANGYGGNASEGTAGEGQGGQVLLQASAGSSVLVGSNATANTDAFGGTSTAVIDGAGGNATGGTSVIQTSDGGGTIAILSGAVISANGRGGATTSPSGGRGGDGTGGTAQLYATPGAITIGTVQTDGGVAVSANGTGGIAEGGTGGNGFGGTIAEISATGGGDILIAGFAAVSASGFGGDGAIGGDGVGSGDFDPETGIWTGGAHIFARNGDIVINGGAQLAAMGFGGDASFFNPSAGDNSGGDGFGGYATIHAANSDFGPSSITIDTGDTQGSGIAALYLDGLGGDGGNGSDGATGGAGGIGAGGSGNISAAAGNGTVTIDQVVAFARGIGGNGGNGGSSEIGAGGNGAVGGVGDGGAITVGAASGLAQSVGVNEGFGDYGNVFADASGFGGNGGNGGNGSSGTSFGNGGNGGEARGGGVNLLVRGARVDVDVATLYANATGGEGGLGDGETSSDGNGGNATVGTNAGASFITGIDILVTGRFEIPTQRGTLNAGTITGTAIATGGNGAADGSSLSLGAASVTFLNADGNIGSLDVSVQGAGSAAEALEDSISVINGTVVVDDAFSFTTIGSLSLYADNGSLTAGSITLEAADFVPDTANGTPAIAGTFFAGSFDIQTGNNFITTANLDSVAALSIVAPGSIIARNLDSAGSINTVAGGNIILADLDAGTSIFQRSSGVITENDVTAGGFIDIRSSGGLALGDLVAGDYIDLRSNGAIGLGNATSGETINFQGLGTLTGGAISAGNSVLAETVGAIQLGAITAGITDPSNLPGAQFAARFSSSGAITTGNVNALGRIGFGTPTNLVTGNLTSGEGLLALVGGNITTGAIDVDDHVYFGNYSMAALGGAFATFNIAPILSNDPVPTGGSILVNGTIVAGTLHAAAGTNFSSGNITSDKAGDTDAVIEVDAGGQIVVGNVVANGAIDFDATGSITGGDITSGQEIFIDAEGAVILGNLSAGLINPQPQELDEEVAIGIRSATSIQVENVASADSVAFVSLGTLELGTINTGGDLIALADGNMELGAIDAGGRVFLANASIFVALQDENGDVSAAAVLNSVPVATGGSISLQGPVEAASFQAAAGTTLTGSAISSDGLIDATSVGNMTLGNLVADDDVRLTSGGNIATGSIDTFDDVALTATGSISTLTIFAHDDVSADAGTTITTDDITGNSIELLADGSISTDNLLTQEFFSGAGQHALIPGASITVESGGDISIGNVDALDGVSVSADGAILAGTIDAETFVRLSAGETIKAGDIGAGGPVKISAQGAVDVGYIMVGGGIQVLDVGSGSPVEIFGASIVAGDISTDGYVGLYTPGSLSVGSIDAGHDVIALVGGNAGFGPIDTPERFFLGGYQMFALISGGESFNPEAVFDAEQKSSTGGSATFAGSSSADSFEAYVGDDTTVASVSTTDFVGIDTGGLLTINGTVAGDFVALLSSDIAIGQLAQINAPGGVAFITINSVGTYIGDNLAGQDGYRLGQAELDRVNSNQFEFEIHTDRGAAGMMHLGDLKLDFSPGEEDGTVLEFSISNEDEEGAAGVIRVVGDVDLTLAADQEVEFEVETFEIDAATGSLALTDASGALSGILSIEAKNIFIASGDILAKLEQNPQYAGFREELNAPAAVQRPEGVIRAAVITLGEDDVSLENILIQNTGSLTAPAGFFISDLTLDFDGDDDGLEGQPDPGSINMVINGQVQTQNGTVGGSVVRDAFVEEFGTEIFVAGSTINGCALVGACSAAAQPQPPIVNTPTSTDVPLSGNGGLGDGLFGNEGEIDDGEGGDGDDQSSPISPPNPLFDSRPLTQSGDVDDPVSGAGNPSLYGSLDDDEDEDEDEKKKKKAKAKQGDGK